MVNFLDPLTTFATLIIPILVTNLWQAVTSRNWKAPLKRFWLMIILFVGFLFVGAELAVTLDTEILLLLLGTSVAVFAAFSLIKPRERPLSPMVEHIAAPFTGALGGLLGGLTAIWGPPMMMLFVMLKLEKDDWVQTVGLVWFVGSVPLNLRLLAEWHVEFGNHAHVALRLPAGHMLNLDWRDDPATHQSGDLPQGHVVGAIRDWN